MIKYVHGLVNKPMKEKHRGYIYPPWQINV